MDDDARQVLGSVASSAALGAAGGGALAGALGRRRLLGAVVGAGAMGAGQVGVSLGTPANRLPPLPWRITTSGLLAAALGSLADRRGRRADPVVVGVAAGTATAAFGARLERLALGAGVGAAVGFGTRRTALGSAATAAGTAVAYRAASAALWRGRDRVRLVAADVPAEAVPEVVPLTERSRHVGPEYLARLAAERGGTYARDPLDVGIVGSLDELAGPDFDPSLVHPTIVEFYEHTSRFALDIVPEWRRWIRPAYLAYLAVVARPLGQAAVPATQRQALRGMVSTIDTLTDDAGVTTRAWIRTYADTGEPIYVGIYTTARHGDRGYVSVGFPVPGGSFTATLAPGNLDDGLVLTSDAPEPFAGHFLTAVDDDGDLSVVRLPSFGERIAVWVRDGRLGADHTFSLGGREILTLRYAMRRR